MFDFTDPVDFKCEGQVITFFSNISCSTIYNQSYLLCFYCIRRGNLHGEWIISVITTERIMFSYCHRK